MSQPIYVMIPVLEWERVKKAVAKIESLRITGEGVESQVSPTSMKVNIRKKKNIQAPQQKATGGASQLLRPCTLTKTGGSDGDGTNRCSWVYTVTDSKTGEEKATGVSPEHRRLKAKTEVATVGMYWMDGSTCHLTDTDESPNFSGCA